MGLKINVSGRGRVPWSKGYDKRVGPQVESPNEFSLAQMWITSGTYEKKDVNAIEAGWQVCEYAQYLLCALL